jgi:glycosyltransferase involved in cell wall biosynthesis
MKIVFNTDQIYLHGGIERVMAIKANHFANIPDVEVYIVTTEQGSRATCYSLHEDIKLIDLAIGYNREKSYFSFENIKKAIVHKRKQRKLFKRLKPDIIISPNFNFDHFWLPFIKGEAKLIKERHGSRYFENLTRNGTTILRKMRFRFMDWIDAKYDHIVVLNQDEKEFVYSGNAIVIPNPIDESSFVADMNQKKVIAAGRISPVKAFDQLINAWRIIVQKFPDWQLHIYGEDYLGTKELLQEKIYQYKLENVIVFCGSVDNIPKAMRDYSIYAMSSKTECFPMVLLEALSVGLPIVSYDCPTGPRNIIENNKEGFLVEDKNVYDLAQHLMILMNNLNLRKEFSVNSKLKLTHFETQTVMKKWLTLCNL